MRWSRWWVAMWGVIAGALLYAAFHTTFWHWWTWVGVGFGIPEAIGVWKQDDAYPPLTHVIVRYIPMELGLPALYLLAGSIGAYWIAFENPGRIGALVGFIGWLDAHFMPRWLRKYNSKEGRENA